MKRICAYVKPNMLDDVIFALHELDDFSGATISEVQEIGCAAGKKDDHQPLHTFLKQVRLELICPDEQVESLVALIAGKAHTGLPDDGAIVVSAVEDVVHIQTGEE